jgi:hypothetical protein
MDAVGVGEQFLKINLQLLECTNLIDFTYPNKDNHNIERA